MEDKERENETVLKGETDAPKVLENQIPKHAVVPSPDDVFDEQEVAALLKCDVATVRYYTGRTKQLAYAIVGKKRLIRRKDLVDFLDRRRVRSVNEVPLSKKERT